ncbi:MAG: ABC transporter permease [Bacillota bacterium]
MAPDLELISKSKTGYLEKFRLKLIELAVPLLFIGLCAIGAYYARLQPTFLINEILLRMARNPLLVLALIIPVVAGMGMNFAIVLGAMAGQIGVIMVTHYEITGITGFLGAVLIATPFAILFGYLTGKLLNRAKGKEMITSMIFGFFACYIWQLFFLVFVGSIIPMQNEKMILSSGVGVRNTVDLVGIRHALDNIIKIKTIPGLAIPVSTLIVVALFCLLITFFMKTKLGHDIRAVGQSMEIAAISGINVDKVRITAVVLSTVLAAWGQLIWLQNIGTLNTYGSHVQVGLFAVAALLIGGASVTKANIWQVLLGTFLFHMMFIISPAAGRNLLGDAQIGEFFRVFVAYGVIAVALLLHAWQRLTAAKKL